MKAKRSPQSPPAPLDLMAIMAHRDDAEIVCGGILIKHARMGYRVGILDLTEGEMGTSGSAQIRAAEAAEASRIMGLAVRDNLALPDSALEETREYKLLIAAKLRIYRPHVVILPLPEQRHPDHRMASILGHDACFLAGLAKLPLAGEAFRPHTILYPLTFQSKETPSFLVDISEVFEAKKAAVLAYRSQFLDGEGNPKLMRNLWTLPEVLENEARRWGTQIATRHAEPYLMKNPFAVDDVTKFAVASI